jgi:hypothetical protein
MPALRCLIFDTLLDSARTALYVGVKISAPRQTV